VDKECLVLRIVFVKIKLDSIEVVRRPIAPYDPGTARVVISPGMKSVFQVATSWLCGAVVTIIGRLSGHGSVPDGLFEDADHAGVFWSFVSAKNDPRAFMETLPVSTNTRIFKPWDQAAKSPRPVSVFVGTMPHNVRDATGVCSLRTRYIPAIARAESGYHPTRGNVMDFCGSIHGLPMSREMMAASCLGVRHVFLSESNKTAMMDLFWRPYMAPSVVRALEAASAVIPNGVPDTDQTRLGLVDAPRGRTVGSFYAVKAGKGVPDLLRLYDSMAYNTDRIYVTQGAHVSIDDFIKSDKVDHRPGSKRDDFLKVAHTCAAAVWNSMGEGSPIAPVEAAFMGCVPIFPARDWFINWDVGKWPLTYNRLSEVPGILNYVWTHQDEWTAKARAWAENYSGSIRGRQFTDYCANAVSAYAIDEKKLNGEFASEIRGVMDRAGEILRWEDIATVVRPWSRQTGFMLTAADVIEFVSGSGWTDLGGAYPTWKRA